MAPGGGIAVTVIFVECFSGFPWGPEGRVEALAVRSPGRQLLGRMMRSEKGLNST